MDSRWETGEDPAGEGGRTTGVIGGIKAPSGAVVVDRDALVPYLADLIEKFRDEVGDDWESDDLAESIVHHIERSNR
ncbi:hypothetical protein OOK31_38490 [Streptomyces sp. NBC_00249]|uniref:hypothetical protein n=1 Tax=Streptomyces sp. NBC_00249 TaxID=2975690 RepID=UPI002253C742|nr:hypothetical protein [Streptomyces sp. NBC_00249]MCX5199701.1 hypothetical protein [Streptomyces sp. NBC_00249]